MVAGTMEGYVRFVGETQFATGDFSLFFEKFTHEKVKRAFVYQRDIDFRLLPNSKNFFFFEKVFERYCS